MSKIDQTETIIYPDDLTEKNDLLFRLIYNYLNSENFTFTNYIDNHIDKCQFDIEKEKKYKFTEYTLKFIKTKYRIKARRLEYYIKKIFGDKLNEIKKLENILSQLKILESEYTKKVSQETKDISHQIIGQDKQWQAEEVVIQDDTEEVIRQLTALEDDIQHLNFDYIIHNNANNYIIYNLYKINNKNLISSSVIGKYTAFKFIINLVEEKMNEIIFLYIASKNFAKANFINLNKIIKLPCLNFILNKYSEIINIKIEANVAGKVNTTDYFYYFLFHFDILLDSLKDDENNNEGEINLLNTFFSKIYDKIVIIIDNCDFILIEKTIWEGTNFYRIKSIKRDEKKIHTLIYYASNSGLGLLRLALIYPKGILAKFLDYNTETQIHFSLQEKIYNKRILLYKNIRKFDDIPDMTDLKNLELLSIEFEIYDRYILTKHKRGYYSFYLSIFDNFSCGHFFTETNLYDKINIFNNTILNPLITYVSSFKKKKDINKISKPENEIKNISFKDIYLKDVVAKIINIIPIMFNNYDKFILKINSISKLLTNICAEKEKVLQGDTSNYTERFDIIYELLGKILDLIIDEVIEETMPIFQYEFEMQSDLRNYETYIFINYINRITVLIDNKEWFIYLNKYNVKIKDQYGEYSDFDDECENFYIINKIIVKETEKINVFGLDGGFIKAGLFQCKPLDYINQLGFNTVDETDKNFINSNYYFIGKSANQLFYNLEKYQSFKSSSSKGEEFKYKYLKYKKKYIES